MGDITKNLSRSEFACPCPRHEDAVDFEVAFVIQECIDHFQALYPDKQVKSHFNSANRCLEYNRTLVDSKGNRLSEDSSQHVLYKGVDFFLYDGNTGSYSSAKHIDDNDVADYLEDKYQGKYGIGRYVGRTHFDPRKIEARWDRR